METESIQGEDVIQVFKHKKDNRTLVEVRLPEKDCNRLTVVSDVWIKRRLLFFLNNRDEVYFRIDEPEGLKEALADQSDMKLHFEFADRDRLPYTFETHGGEVDGGRIWLKLPEAIQRLQRRLYFRIEVPEKTFVQLDMDGQFHRVALENISLGGALAASCRRKPDDGDLPMINEGRTLDNIQLLFPPAKGGASIAVARAVVRRMQKDNKLKKHQFALHFAQIEPSEEKRLTRLIYKIQRERLSRRLPVDGNEITKQSFKI